jgi:predicted Zn-dependent peptidase
VKPVKSLSFFLSFLFIPLSEAGLREQVFETILPNGLKVILLENPKAPLITFHIWYRVGSRNEEWGRTGLSHMLEHMMFKGTYSMGNPATGNLSWYHLWFLAYLFVFALLLLPLFRYFRREDKRG